MMSTRQLLLCNSLINCFGAEILLLEVPYLFFHLYSCCHLLSDSVITHRHEIQMLDGVQYHPTLQMLVRMGAFLLVE